MVVVVVVVDVVDVVVVEVVVVDVVAVVEVVVVEVVVVEVVSTTLRVINIVAMPAPTRERPSSRLNKQIGEYRRRIQLDEPLHRSQILFRTSLKNLHPLLELSPNCSLVWFGRLGTSDHASIVFVLGENCSLYCRWL